MRCVKEILYGVVKRSVKAKHALIKSININSSMHR